MVIDNFDIVGVFTSPAKAETPLIVDADAVLAATVTFEGFQAVAGRKPHDVESVGSIELEEFSSGGALDIGWQVTRGRAGKEPCGLGIGKAFDHEVQPRWSRESRKGK